MAEDDGVVRRWHRRKTAARGASAEEKKTRLVSEESHVPMSVGHEGLAVPDETGAVVDGPLDLPDIDSLDAGSDFSIFMQKGVPEAIQRLALRKLWALDPVLANVDGLVDYGEDFTDAATIVEGLKSVYRVGKGMLSDEEIAARDGGDDAADQADPAKADTGADGPVLGDEGQAVTEVDDPNGGPPPEPDTV